MIVRTVSFYVISEKEHQACRNGWIESPSGYVDEEIWFRAPVWTSVHSTAHVLLTWGGSSRTVSSATCSQVCWLINPTKSSHIYSNSDRRCATDTNQSAISNLTSCWQPSLLTWSAKAATVAKSILNFLTNLMLFIATISMMLEKYGYKLESIRFEEGPRGIPRRHPGVWPVLSSRT